MRPDGQGDIPLKAVRAVLSGFGDGWRLRVLILSARRDQHLSIMETTEEIWNKLEELVDYVGKVVELEITGYKITKVTLAE